MFLTILIIFITIFLCSLGLMIGSTASASRDAKRALARLDSALANNKKTPYVDLGGFTKDSSLSAVPWINKLLKQFQPAARLQILLMQAGSEWNVGIMLLGSATLFTVSASLVNWKTAALVLSIGVGAILGFMPFLIILIKRARRFSRFEQELPNALALMVSALRVGHSLNAALGLISRECQQPLAGEFKICFEEQNFGLELRNALENLIARVPLNDLRIAVTAILVQKESGGNLAEVLDNTAHVIRERFRLKRQVKTHTAQGRMTGWVLSFLPLILGFALYAVNPDAMRLLWTRDIGIKLLYVGGIMMIVGSLVIRNIVNMEV